MFIGDCLPLFINATLRFNELISSWKLVYVHESFALNKIGRRNFVRVKNCTIFLYKPISNLMIAIYFCGVSSKWRLDEGHLKT